MFPQATLALETAQTHVYDAIVVGAGPAGASCAYHLAKQGIEVLLLDRALFPRDKRCGDAIMPPALAELARMGVVEEVQQRFRAAERIGVWQGRRPGSYVPLGEGSKGYVAPRREFDALLWQRARQVGASWLDQVVVREVIPGEAHALLRGSRGQQTVTLRARIVIAADGSGSRLARNLRASVTASPNSQQPLYQEALTLPPDDRARFTAMRGYFRGIEGLSDALEFYFRTEVGPSYSWIFPVGQGIANVGVIASMEHLRGSHKMAFQDALMAFLHAPELEGRAAQAHLEGTVGAAPIAAGLRGTALFGERLLCVGDAAALVDPNSAEGISGALWSGRMAAETAIDALQRNDCSFSSLSSYGRVVRECYQEPYERMLAHP